MKNIFFKFDFLPVDQMVVLEYDDIVLAPWDGAADECDMYAELHLVEEEYQPARMRFTEHGSQYWNFLRTTLVGTSGLIHVKFRPGKVYSNEYQGYWTVQFCANDTAAWRTALMEEKDFEKVIEPLHIAPSERA